VIWRFAGGMLATLLPCLAATAEKAPCEPSKECALRLVREMTLQQAKLADGDSLWHWLAMTEWLERADTATDPFAARARFDVLLKQIRRVGGPADRAINEQWLASAMLDAGLLADTEELSSGLPERNRQVIYAKLATKYAELGEWRDAVRLLELMSDVEGGRPNVYQDVLDRIADAARPELISQSASLMKSPPAYWVPLGLVLVDVAAGNEDGALKRALAHPEPGWRVGLVAAIANRYRDRKREGDSLRIEAMRLELAQGLASPEWLAEQYRWYFKRLVEAHEYSKALDSLPRLPASDRNPWGLRDTLLVNLRNPADIEAASKLLSTLDGGSRQSTEACLIWARVFAGMVEPSVALQGASDPARIGASLVGLLGNGLHTEVDRGRARALFAVAEMAADASANPDPMSLILEEGSYHRSVVRAQIALDLLEDARASITTLRTSRSRATSLLELSAAYSRQGKSELAESARVDGLAELEKAKSPEDPDLGASILLRAGMPDDAEAELRRLMKAGSSAMAFSRVGKPLLEEKVRCGQVASAFQFAYDWSLWRDRDPEAVGTFYSLLAHIDSPPIRGPALEAARKARKGKNS
jgi:hypothetical protein